MMVELVCESTSPSFPLLMERTSVIAPLSETEGNPAQLGRRGGMRLFAKEPKVRLLKKEKIKFIEYNRAYIDYAKENRRTPTKLESIFWWIVKDRRLFWYKFKRQKVIWSFILDFYCPELLLWIELDGWYHNDRGDYDRYRDAKIFKQWVLVVRFKNEEIEKNLSWVISELKEIIKERREMLIHFTL